MFVTLYKTCNFCKVCYNRISCNTLKMFIKIKLTKTYLIIRLMTNIVGLNYTIDKFFNQVYINKP